MTGNPDGPHEIARGFCNHHIIHGDAFRLLLTEPRVYDLILTSPPAYPSPRQASGSLGTEPTFDAYLDRLADVTRMAGRVLRQRGILCLVLQPVDGHPLMERLAQRLAAQWWRVLNTYHWSPGDGTASWVVFLSRSERATLNRKHPAWATTEWAIKHDAIDAGYGFYEFPKALVEAIVGLALPRGGRILDPFIGKGVALRSLGQEYQVRGYDIMPEAQTRPASPAPTA